jgi:heme a synthase
MTQTPAWLRRLTIFVALSTLFLIFAGAMVTSTGSGLAVPDWPLSYGQLMPPMVAGIFYEHGHRMIAATVGLLTVIQAICLQLFSRSAIAKKLGWTSVGAVVAQGLLGGLTVLFLLPHAVSIAHAGLAEIFFGLNVSIAFFANERARAQAPRVRGIARLLVAAIYCQILLGALVRHLGAGLAIPDFPLAFGKVIPPIASAAVAANFAHRTGALVVTILVLATAIQCYRSRMTALPTMLLALVATQIYLGAKVIWDGAEHNYHSLAGQAAIHHASITSFHVMTGAATLAVSLLIALASRATAAQETVASRAGAFVASEVTA